MSLEYHFSTREQAAKAAANRIVDLLNDTLGAQPEASLVVSGGSTPVGCFKQLAGADLAWERVHVVMSDERWVSPDDPSSNEKLVKETLLVDAAAPARLLPVFASGVGIDERCSSLDRDIRTLPQPFACTLLGMGEDGHFASLFPDADNLEAGLDHEATNSWIPVTTTASPLPRVSMTLAALLHSREILLLIFGDAKLKILEAARESSERYPVSRLLAQQQTQVRVFWAP